MLAPIAEAAREKGASAYICRNPLDPEKLDHIILPGNRLAFVSVSRARPCPLKVARTIHISPEDMRDKSVAKRAKYISGVRESLIADAVDRLAESAAFHAELELHYSPNVDFSGAEALADSLADALI